VNSLSQQELTHLIVQWVRNNRQAEDFADPEITEDTDLMASGILDSYGFVDLLLFLEQQTGNKVDLAEVDPTAFTIVKSLCQIVLAGSNPELVGMQEVPEQQSAFQA